MEFYSSSESGAAGRHRTLGQVPKITRGIAQTGSSRVPLYRGPAALQSRALVGARYTQEYYHLMYSLLFFLFER